MLAIDTGCVACQKSPVTGVLGMLAIDTGCVACQNKPVTPIVLLLNCTLIGLSELLAVEFLLMIQGLVP